MRRSRRPLGWCLVAVALVTGCDSRGGDDVDAQPTQPVRDDRDAVAAEPPHEDIADRERPSESKSSVLFTDVTAEVGLDFSYRTRLAEGFYLPGIMGGGGAIFDADDDGDLDIYLVNGHDGTENNARRNRLYLQESDGRVVDATDASGLGDRGDGMGCAVLDIDNDGDLDVYVTNMGPDRLFRNEGGGTFVDVTEAAGIDNPAWATAVTALDANRDGWLDLYVANYVDYDEEVACVDDAGRPDYCSPWDFTAVSDRFYLNRGDGTFVDATTRSGIGSVAYAGLGAVCADFDEDGWIDIYVANDKHPNQLWVNGRDETFIDDGIIAGAAYNADGLEEAGMGVAAGDADGDGDLDLLLTHFMAETNTFYRNLGDLMFEDASAVSGLGAPSLPYTGWGTAFFDADLDGDLDVAVANGAVKRRELVLRDDLGFWNDYAEPDLFLRNDGRGRFQRIGDEAGALTREIAVSRGLMPADFDGDGDLDLVVLNVASPARLYRNETNHDSWLAISVIDPALRREAIGAVVTVHTDTATYVRHAIPPGGYLSGGTATIHLGLPPQAAVTSIDVRWPGGDVERFEGIERGRVALRRGSGASPP